MQHKYCNNIRHIITYARFIATTYLFKLPKLIFRAAMILIDTAKCALLIPSLF